MAPEETVKRWLADEQLVDRNLGMFQRISLWAMLRALPGLDLPDFLLGTRHAYGEVTRLMYRRNFAALEPLVAPACLEAMQQTMDEFGAAAHRVVDADLDGAIAVRRAVLCGAEVFKPAPDDAPDAPRRCLLDVRFEVSESFSIHDMRTGEPIAPFDGRERLAQSTWRWEGAVAPPAEDGGEPADAEEGWRVHSLV